MASEWHSLIRYLCVIVIAASAGMMFSSAHRTPYQVAASPGVVVLHDDAGGNVADHVKWYARLGRSHVPVRIEGYCNSACTFVLRLPRQQVCITPRATLGFHLASTNGVPDRKMTRQIVRQVYPRPVQQWIRVNGPLTTDLIQMDAKTAIALGVVRACA